MTRADLLLVNDIRNILANGTKDENPRPKYEVGTFGWPQGCDRQRIQLQFGRIFYQSW